MNALKNMRKFDVVLLVVFFTASIGLYVWQMQWPEANLYINGQSLRVLVANTPSHTYRGLGKRDGLAPYDGMLFIHPYSGRHGIVMRAMRFPIDIVWLLDGQVVDIAPNVPLADTDIESKLPVYYPRSDANQVLELNAGAAERYGLKIGFQIKTSP